MTEQEIVKYCLSFHGAFERYPFGPSPLVMTIQKTKGFCYINKQTKPLHIILKCDPKEACILRSIFSAIKPGYHFNKDHWNSVYIDGSIQNEHIKEMIKKSYELVSGYRKVNIAPALIAPCGINCSLCSGYQKAKDACAGCNNIGDKPGYCITCELKTCNENRNKYCNTCKMFPCKRLINLEKRYRTKYGVNIYENMNNISNHGINSFIKEEKKKWTCIKCATVLCMHKEHCSECNSINPNYIGT
jgi:predicted DNA-binding protein (MmcQ/YjbR family)